MKRRIIVHGYLRKLVPQVLDLAVDTVAEAVEALCVVTGRALQAVPGRGRHRVCVVGFPTREAIYSPLSDDIEELHLVPAFAGAGSGGGMIQMVVGAVIIIAAVILSPYTGGASLNLIPLGASLMIGGLLALISPAPKNSLNSSPEASLYLGTPQNTTQIGTPIPIGYGTMLVYGQILSAEIVAGAADSSGNLAATPAVQI